MARKNLALALCAIGLIGALVSGFAEPLGLGRDNGVGGRQIAGIVGGVVLLLIGAAMAAKAPKTA